MADLEFDVGEGWQLEFERVVLHERQSVVRSADSYSRSVQRLLGCGENGETEHVRRDSTRNRLQFAERDRHSPSRDHNRAGDQTQG
jgi:hypothetical protein